MEKTISMAQLARNTAEIARDIEASGAVYRIKQRGHKTMLLMDQEYFDSWVVTREFMQDHPNWRAELEQGERAYRAGLSVPYEALKKELGLDRAPRHAKRGRAARGSTRAGKSRRR